MTHTKKSDTKGRIALGVQHAGQTFLVEEKANGDLVLKKAVVVPAHKATKTATLVIKSSPKQKSPNLKVVAREASPRKMRGFLKGIDTNVPRDKDRV